MDVLNPETVIEDSLETAFSLKAYMRIISEIQRDDFIATPDFRKMFNGFYRVRQKTAAWYDTYYKLLEEQKKEGRSFREILQCLESVNGTIDVSFVSKMMAAVDPNLPIWDRYVLQDLGLLKRWEKLSGKDKTQRMDEAERIYEDIKTWYVTFARSKDGMACIAAFDSAMPNYKEKLTAVKKIDYLLWSKR